MPAKALELQHTIRLIQELDAEIEEIEYAIQAIMEEFHSPITTIPGIGFHMGAMILAEADELSRFDSPDKLLAYAGMSPSTYQSGQLKKCYPHMEKRGSRYLRYALYNATKYVCHWGPVFAAYLAKKQAERGGKDGEKELSVMDNIRWILGSSAQSIRCREQHPSIFSGMGSRIF